MNEDHVERRLLECKDSITADVTTLRRRVDDLTIAATAIAEMHDDVKAMKEILEAWNSVKGFVTTMKFLSAAVKWTTVVVAPVAAVWYFFRFGEFPPSHK